MPYIWYEKLSSSCIKYIFVMEEYGYLTKNEVRNLENELIAQGFNSDKLKISYTASRVTYGNPIFLKVAYDYELKIPFIEKEITLKDALIIGCSQVFALIPGFSRSGTTIAAARSLGIKREDAAKFSFYLSAPVVLGAVVLSLLKDDLSDHHILVLPPRNAYRLCRSEHRHQPYGNRWLISSIPSGDIYYYNLAL